MTLLFSSKRQPTFSPSRVGGYERLNSCWVVDLLPKRIAIASGDACKRGPRTIHSSPSATFHMHTFLKNALDRYVGWDLKKHPKSEYFLRIRATYFRFYGPTSKSRGSMLS